MTQSQSSAAIDLSDLKGRRNVLLDLDDTIYACKPCEEAGLRAFIALASPVLSKSARELEDAWMKARAAVKERVDLRGSSHSRLLYISELVHSFGRVDAFPYLRAWERMYWEAFIETAKVKPRVVPFFEAIRNRGGRVAIVSDLTLEVQLFKLERFGILRYIDAIVTSEEVPHDKPKRPIFRVAIDRLGTSPETCVVVGDSEEKDGEGARRMGIPFFKIDPKDTEGAAFDEIVRVLSIGDEEQR